MGSDSHCLSGGQRDLKLNPRCDTAASMASGESPALGFLSAAFPLQIEV